ncbi:hypothetical protein CPAR01_15019 [Colletotrichum paranaense]|uniref:Uncharacterized protein n=1 Tax=Colletotrichum paranaense TaxID=1914294 RepID=A0ABQ9S0N1_9PEZI|nr:uncharacterized protein CPAR01_15019 [Colletotrichum paranaense]KAK1521496.1 hypothetical protein CPAR01_15019 [Colletotrichum paranaense]
MGRPKFSQSRWRQAAFYFAVAAFSTFFHQLCIHTMGEHPET